MSRFYLGLSGYAYTPWRGEGKLYPEGTKVADFFKIYSDRYPAVEMDGTWYRMPSEEAVAKWTQQATPEFRYTFKVHRSVTHLKRLMDDSVESVEFMLKRLKEALDSGKVGCVYFQFPPNFKRTDDRLEKFVARLPSGIPFGMEFRNVSWNTAEVADILASRSICYVSSDDDGRDGVRRDTGTVLYARMRRETYSDEEYEDWASWFAYGIRQGKDAYVFMKHEDEGAPWIEADRLAAHMAKLGIPLG